MSTVLKRPLQGVGVLVTRPTQQAEPFCQRIEAAGGVAIRFPVLEIRDPADLRGVRTLIQGLDRFDLAIFISPNAATKGVAHIRERGALPKHLKIAAIGKGTAQALQRLGMRVDLCPAHGSDSEALLAMDALANVSGQQIVIFRGEGGRELLGDTLRERGAQVEYAQVYRRARPQVDPEPLLKRWWRGEIEIVTVTSGEGLENLFAMVGEAGHAQVRATPLIVVSQRTAERARERGVHQVYVAPEPGDAGMLDAILAWYSQRSRN